MIVFLPRDPFDLREARRLVAQIEALPPDTRVRIDVTRVRELHPTALAGLACALDGDDRVAIVGLRRHHERLLAYLLAGPPRSAPRLGTSDARDGGSWRAQDE
jgi:hypothetical protein